MIWFKKKIMTTITITKLYQLLSEKTDKKTAEVLTSYVEKKVEREVSEQSKILATKEDLYKIKVDLIKCIVSLFITLALMIIGLYLK